MFKRLREVDDAERVEVFLDGQPLVARRGDTVAAALVASGKLACRITALSAAARGPYCMMGACFDCLVTIDGQRNQQGCMMRVRDGMRIETRPPANAVTR